ncbi:carbamate kinase [Egicoccus halophilus]|uniref:Carbamate kinase n=1 Tax=Egicoccus halophilus TaxID=1670830 RepID=A0A8J3EWR5_9ACTN|nr:carbamate kinase [Egicoccus halophilus]GGI04240.1 carbamate kinase [Egicoccus halophilus]
MLAFGGNAIAPQGAGTAAEQTERLWATMRQVAELVTEGRSALVLTHGNGPQVGNVLIKNELARDVVPPVPLDWCVAQTQATIGFTIADTLTHELDRRGIAQPVVPVVSRVLVDADDPGFQAPSKPIGPWLEDGDEVARREGEGLRFLADPDRGWRRLVPSPQPRRSVDRAAVELLLDDGAIVVANGGGGIPVVDDGEGPLHGIEAVIDKDLAGALLAEEIDADTFVILTDVPGVAVDFGTPRQRWLETVTVTELRAHADDGQFGAGSMGPKVAAACAFVERTGQRAAIGALEHIVAVVHGRAGTQVVPA